MDGFSLTFELVSKSFGTFYRNEESISVTFIQVLRSNEIILKFSIYFKQTLHNEKLEVALTFTFDFKIFLDDLFSFLFEPCPFGYFIDSISNFDYVLILFLDKDFVSTFVCFIIFIH